MTNNNKLDTNIALTDTLLGLQVALASVLHTINPGKLLLVTDMPCFLHCYPLLSAWLPAHNVCILSGTETHKDINAISQIIKALADLGADRHSLVINLGGGIVGDVGGFASAIYMRGIRFINIPTTLLAMVDASVGGKTGINFGGVKNLVGSYKQPEKVIVCPIWLKTLPPRELKAGLAEMLKHGLIADAAAFYELAEAINQTDDYLKNIDRWIAHSVGIKANIVASDFEEKGPRKLLNLGHTVAHALEAIAHQPTTTSHIDAELIILHGEAVALGLWIEGMVATHVAGLGQAELAAIKQTMLNLVPTSALTLLATADKQALITAMMLDKKNKDGQLKFVLLNAIGNASYDITVGTDQVLHVLAEAQQQVQIYLQAGKEIGSEI